MRIVRATEPPSMSVIVDTVVCGEVELAVRASHAQYDRIDIVFAKDGVVGILPGTPSASPLRPALATGMRKIAVILVPSASYAIHDVCILERDD